MALQSGYTRRALPDPLGRILITGANGSLGRRLIARLAAQGTPVRAVVRSERAAAALRDLPEKPETAVLEYADAAALEAAARGCEAAVHLVGIIKESATSSYAAAHEATTDALLRAAAGSGLARIVYLSIPGAHPEARNACLASKGRAEHALLDSAISSVVLRVPMVLGPGDFAARALRGQARAKWVPLLRGGRGLEQPIDAEDVISAAIVALSSSALSNVALDLAGPESLPRRALLQRCAALYDNEPSVLPLPVGVLRALAWVLEKALGNPPLTPAMLEILAQDDAIDASSASERLGIRLTPLDDTLRRCVGPEAP